MSELNIISIRGRAIQLVNGDKFILRDNKLYIYPTDISVLNRPKKSIIYRGSGTIQVTRQNQKYTHMQISKNYLVDIIANLDKFDITQEKGTVTYTYKKLRCEK